MLTKTDNRKGHKPKPNHPWAFKNQMSGEARNWAREQSFQSHIVNYKVGGGKPQK